MSNSFQNPTGLGSLSDAQVKLIAQTLFQQASAFHQKGQFDQARSLYESLLKVQPHHFEGLQAFGYLAYQTNQFEMAIHWLSKAIEVNPNAAELHSNIALCYRALQRFEEEALTSYDKAIASKESPQSHYKAVRPARIHQMPLPLGFESHYLDYQYRCNRFAEADVIDIDGHAIRVLERLIEPEIVVFENLLSAAECELLIDLSRPKLRPSPTFDRNNTSGKGKLSAERTSEGAGFLRAENKLIHNIEMRIAKLLDLPFENGEEINILHYITGAEYRPHFDFFAPEDKSSAAFLQHAGQRVATLIMYLNDVESGGETIFPGIEFSVTPRKGGAVFFSYCDANGKLDRLSLHGGAPVIEGEKWIATKWIRQRGYKI